MVLYWNLSRLVGGFEVGRMVAQPSHVTRRSYQGPRHDTLPRIWERLPQPPRLGDAVDKPPSVPTRQSNPSECVHRKELSWVRRRYDARYDATKVKGRICWAIEPSIIRIRRLEETERPSGTIKERSSLATVAATRTVLSDPPGTNAFRIRDRQWRISRLLEYFGEGLLSERNERKRKEVSTPRMYRMSTYAASDGLAAPKKSNSSWR